MDAWLNLNETSKALNLVIQYYYPFILTTSAGLILLSNLDRKLELLATNKLNVIGPADAIILKEKINECLRRFRDLKHTLISLCVAMLIMLVLFGLFSILLAPILPFKSEFHFFLCVAFFFNLSLIVLIVYCIYISYDIVHKNIHNEESLYRA